MERNTSEVKLADQCLPLRFQPLIAFLLIERGIRVGQSKMRREFILEVAKQSLALQHIGVISGVQAEAGELDDTDNLGKTEVEDKEGRLGRVVERSCREMQADELVVWYVSGLMSGEMVILYREGSTKE